MLSAFGVGLGYIFFVCFLKFKGLHWEMDAWKEVDVDGAHAPVPVGNEASLPSTTKLHLNRVILVLGRCCPSPGWV